MRRRDDHPSRPAVSKAPVRDRDRGRGARLRHGADPDRRAARVPHRGERHGRGHRARTAGSSRRESAGPSPPSPGCRPRRPPPCEGTAASAAPRPSWRSRRRSARTADLVTISVIGAPPGRLGAPAVEGGRPLRRPGRRWSTPRPAPASARPSRSRAGDFASWARSRTAPTSRVARSSTRRSPTPRSSPSTGSPLANAIMVTGTRLRRRRGSSSLTTTTSRPTCCARSRATIGTIDLARR